MSRSVKHQAEPASRIRRSHVAEQLKPIRKASTGSAQRFVRLRGHLSNPSEELMSLFGGFDSD
jgi:hypothetical protein